MLPPLRRVGLQHPVVANRLTCSPQKCQQDDREPVDQPQPITSLRGAHMHRSHPSPGFPPAFAGGTFARVAPAEAEVLAIAQTRLDSPPTAVIAGQILGRRLGAGGRQAPGLLHLRVADADHGANRIAIRCHHRPAPHTRPHAAAVWVTPLAVVTLILPRKRMTYSKCNSSVSSR